MLLGVQAVLLLVLCRLSHIHSSLSVVRLRSQQSGCSREAAQHTLAALVRAGLLRVLCGLTGRAFQYPAAAPLDIAAKFRQVGRQAKELAAGAPADDNMLADTAVVPRSGNPQLCPAVELTPGGSPTVAGAPSRMTAWAETRQAGGAARTAAAAGEAAAEVAGGAAAGAGRTTSRSAQQRGVVSAAEEGGMGHRTPAEAGVTSPPSAGWLQEPKPGTRA